MVILFQPLVIPSIADALRFSGINVTPTKPPSLSCGVTSLRICSPLRSTTHTIGLFGDCLVAVSYTHLRAHETDSYLVCRLLLEKKKKIKIHKKKKKKNNKR